LEGVVFDLRRYSVYDGPGIRTTVFLKGCPLNCIWCHNPESQKLQPESFKRIVKKNLGYSHSETTEFFGKIVTADEIMTEIERDILFFDDSGGGVTFSGGEPLVQLDFLNELLYRCNKKGIHTAVDTSGCMPTANFEKIIDKTDLFLFDIKLIDEEEHKKYTGSSNRVILDNLKFLAESGKNINIRVPLIPGITDTVENLTGIKNFIDRFQSIKTISLLPYNEIAENKYTRLNKTFLPGTLVTQSAEQLKEIESIFENINLTIKLRG